MSPDFCALGRGAGVLVLVIRPNRGPKTSRYIGLRLNRVLKKKQLSRLSRVEKDHESIRIWHVLCPTRWTVRADSLRALLTTIQFCKNSRYMYVLLLHRN